MEQELEELLGEVDTMVRAAQKIEAQIKEIGTIVETLILSATWYPADDYGSNKMVVPTHLLKALDEKTNKKDTVKEKS